MIISTCKFLVKKLIIIVIPGQSLVFLADNKSTSDKLTSSFPQVHFFKIRVWFPWNTVLIQGCGIWSNWQWLINNPWIAADIFNVFNRSWDMLESYICLMLLLYVLISSLSISFSIWLKTPCRDFKNYVNNTVEMFSTLVWPCADTYRINYPCSPRIPPNDSGRYYSLPKGPCEDYNNVFSIICRNHPPCKITHNVKRCRIINLLRRNTSRRRGGNYHS
jgi:hypothetical protein